MYDKAATLNRRNFLKFPLCWGSDSLLAAYPRAQTSSKSEVLRDRFWLYGQEAGAQNGRYGLPGSSYITAAEAGHYLSVPNLIFGWCHPAKLPDSLPEYRRLAIPFRPFRRVVWSIVGCSGKTNSHDRDLVLQLASETPNITGVIMDDFFNKAGSGVLTVEELQQVQRRLKAGDKKLDLWVVLYDTMLDHPPHDYLAACDVITFWSLSTLRQLEQMPSSLAKLEKVAPKARKMFGCYMYNFGEKQPMPVSVMKLQCDWAREWIQHGRIEGVIFDESNICDFDFEAVEWTREWIRKVGDEKLRTRAGRSRAGLFSAWPAHASERASVTPRVPASHRRLGWRWEVRPQPAPGG